MDIQAMLEALSDRDRAAKFKNSGQLTIGMLIEELQNTGQPDFPVTFDFGGCFPVELTSWRGIYKEAALDYVAYGEGKRPLKVAELINHLKDSLDKPQQGYKGGEFVMTVDTPIWADKWGESNDTAIIGVVVTDYKVVITTIFMEPY